MDVTNHISKPALLELCAEECTELAHACLKMARKMRGENPTPAHLVDIRKDLTEEAADVDLCINALIKSRLISYTDLSVVQIEKEKRWEERILENNEEKGE